jgi:nucleotide-binding universal stress UspA family protein
MIIHSILCPVDFSPEAPKIVRGALAVAREEGATVTVLHVVEPLLAEEAALAPGGDCLEERAYEELDVMVARAVEGSGFDPLEIDRWVRRGEPDVEILAAAAKFDVDLIVMGSEAGRGTRRMFGSTAARVLARTKVPVLALPPTLEDLLTTADEQRRLAFRRILIAIDFTESGTLAVRDAALLARHWGAALTLLHVVPDLPDVLHWGDSLDRHQRHEIERARRELELLAHEIEGVPVTVLTLDGAPAESIIRAAAAHETSLIALDQRRPRRGWFAPRPGSTAYRVLSLTNLPVLVLPGVPVEHAAREEQLACVSGHV